MKSQKNKGITLLMTMIILSSVLVVSLSIFFVYFSQLDISRGVRQSLVSFYGADIGKECAMYYRTKVPDLSAGTFGSGFWDPASCGATCQIQCGNKNVTVTHTAEVPPVTGNPGDYDSEDVYSFTIDNDATSELEICVDVEVRILTTSAGTYDTIVRSYGKNQCGAGGFVVERAVEKCEPRDLCRQIN
jgi:hypothetical protein